MTQTAVDYLIDQIELDQFSHAKSPSEWLRVFETARAKEKAQHQFTWEDGQDSFPTRTFEQYYSETFKKD